MATVLVQCDVDGDGKSRHALHVLALGKDDKERRSEGIRKRKKIPILRKSPSPGAAHRAGTSPVRRRRRSPAHPSPAGSIPERFRHTWAYRYFGFTSSALASQLRLFLKQTPKIQIIQWNLGLVEILILWREEDEGKGCGQREEKTSSGGHGRCNESTEEQSKPLKAGHGHTCCFRRDAVHEGAIWSRHAGVSVNRMLEILKHSTHLKEENIVAELDDEDEDEELIKSITSRNSKDYVKRIEDDDGDEDFVIPGQLRFMAEINGSSESVLSPTDVLTKNNST